MIAYNRRKRRTEQHGLAQTYGAPIGQIIPTTGHPGKPPAPIGGNRAARRARAQRRQL
jgi:hypothetical protein